MKLRLYHGRGTPDQTMTEWGFDGPTLQGVKFMISTYANGSGSRVGFHSHEDALIAQSFTGWEFADREILWIKYHEDMIHTTVDGVESFYGDMEVTE